MTMGNKIVKVYVLKGLNGTSLVIENYRVSNKKIYGLLTPIHTFEVLTDDILQAIGQKRNQSDDCVSRQAVIDYLYTNMAWYNENGSIADDSQKLRDITNLVNGIPPVTPTRKSGLHWIERFNNEDKWLECPYCHKDSNNAYNYCPNCGVSFKADKRGNENE